MAGGVEVDTLLSIVRILLIVAMAIACTVLVYAYKKSVEKQKEDIRRTTAVFQSTVLKAQPRQTIKKKPKDQWNEGGNNNENTSDAESMEKRNFDEAFHFIEEAIDLSDGIQPQFELRRTLSKIPSRKSLNKNKDTNLPSVFLQIDNYDNFQGSQPLFEEKNTVKSDSNDFKAENNDEAHALQTMPVLELSRTVSKLNMFEETESNNIQEQPRDLNKMLELQMDSVSDVNTNDQKSNKLNQESNMLGVLENMNLRRTVSNLNISGESIGPVDLDNQTKPADSNMLGVLEDMKLRRTVSNLNISVESNGPGPGDLDNQTKPADSNMLGVLEDMKLRRTVSNLNISVESNGPGDLDKQTKPADSNMLGVLEDMKLRRTVSNLNISVESNGPGDLDNQTKPQDSNMLGILEDMKLRRTVSNLNLSKESNSPGDSHNQTKSQDSHYVLHQTVSKELNGTTDLDKQTKPQDSDMLGVLEDMKLRRTVSNLNLSKESTNPEDLDNSIK